MSLTKVPLREKHLKPHFSPDRHQCNLKTLTKDTRFSLSFDFKNETHSKIYLDLESGSCGDAKAPGPETLNPAHETCLEEVAEGDDCSAVLEPLALLVDHVAQEHHLGVDVARRPLASHLRLAARHRPGK